MMQKRWDCYDHETAGNQIWVRDIAYIDTKAALQTDIIYSRFCFKRTLFYICTDRKE